MNNRRRRANDFTDSLTSFRQTIYEEKQDSIISQKDLEDNFETDSINKQCKSDSLSNESRAGSIIIAGSLGTEQCISSDLSKIAKDNCNIIYNNNQSLLKDTLSRLSDETSYLSLKPDLNKCINLFHNEHLNKEHYTFEDYSNLDSMLAAIKINKDIDPCHLNKNKTMGVQCDLIRVRPFAMSLNSLEDANISISNQDVTNKKICRSKSCSMLNSLKRDTNHNIKANYFSVASTNTATRKNSHKKIDTAALVDALSKSSILPNKENDLHFIEENLHKDLHSTEKNQCYSTNNEKSEEPFNSFELKTFLNSLEHQKSLKGTTAVQDHLVKRLSANFYNSPKTFTEKLLTIIEESVISDDSCAQLKYPEVSLCRLTEELRKMCKFIEDETVPEWPQSPNMSTSIYVRQRSRGPKSPLRKSLNAFASRNKSYLAKSISPQHNIKSQKKICQHTPKNILYNTKNPLHDSTSTFESLEAFCENFYPDECKAVPITKKNQSLLQSIDSILHVCENQMASLENSPDIHEQLKKATTFTSNLPSQCNKVPEIQNLQYKLLTHKKHNKIDSKKVPDIFKQRTEHNKSYDMIESDDLENTLMYEIAKKRQRCLDTAKVMMEINTNSDSVEGQQTCPKLVINESLSNSDAKFIETLMSVKKYQEYLEEHKPILNLFRAGSGSPHISDKKDIQTKEIENFDIRHLGHKVEIATLEVPKFSRMRKKSRSPLTKCSTNKVVSKPKLFVTPGKTPVNKSCKPKRIYFPNLVVGISKEKKFNNGSHSKNIYRQIENYDHVVSPVGMYIKGTDPHLMKNLRPKTDENLLTPRKNKMVRSTSSKPKMKFRLSPEQPKTMTRTTVGNENIADNFLHPKVHYKLPSHVRTIKETENRKVGNRINELLRSTQDKVVIRHEGRIKSVQIDCLKQPEIHYDSTEESVHIEQTARKTCFSRVQKN